MPLAVDERCDFNVLRKVAYALIESERPQNPNIERYAEARQSLELVTIDALAPPERYITPVQA